MDIYLDNCCLNRPFDNQAEPRVHLEAEAIKTILSFIESGTWSLISSNVLIHEINKTANEKRRRNLHGINQMAVKYIEATKEIRERARYFESFGLQAFDAAHLACGEKNSDIFLTVDGEFIKRANQIEGLQVKIMNPLQWLEEVLE